MNDLNKTGKVLFTKLQKLKQKNILLKSEFDKCVKESKRFEHLLKMENQNFAAIFESIPTGILVLDETTCIVFANKAVIKQFRAHEGEILHHRPGNVLNCVHTCRGSQGMRLFR